MYKTMNWLKQNWIKIGFVLMAFIVLTPFLLLKTTPKKESALVQTPTSLIVSDYQKCSGMSPVFNPREWLLCLGEAGSCLDLVENLYNDNVGGTIFSDIATAIAEKYSNKQCSKIMSLCPKSDIDCVYDVLTNSSITEPYQIKELPLNSGISVFFILQSPGNCESEGCSYDVFAGINPKTSKRVYFENYVEDCITNEISFGDYDMFGLFGTLDIDESNKIVKVYNHFNATQGRKSIYYFKPDGTSKIIASYSNICDVNTEKTLFRSPDYSPELTKF